MQWLLGHQQVFLCTVGFARANIKKKRGRAEVGTWVGMFAPVLGPCFKKQSEHIKKKRNMCSVLDTCLEPAPAHAEQVVTSGSKMFSDCLASK